MYNCIVLSGLPLCGNSTLAKRLSEIYGWKVHSIGDLWRAKHKGLYPNGEVSFEEYWAKTTKEDNIEINRKAREVLERGNIIGDMRFAAYYKDLPILLVFIKADLDIRAKRGIDSGKYKGKSIERVNQILLEREELEVKLGKELFGIDYKDLSNYHLVLDSGVLSIEDQISQITKLAPP